MTDIPLSITKLFPETDVMASETANTSRSATSSALAFRPSGGPNSFEYICTKELYSAL